MNKAIYTLAAALLFATAPAFAQETITDPSNCSLTPDQIGSGWTCTEEVVTYDVSKLQGKGCRDGVVEEIVYRIYDPTGELVAELSQDPTMPDKKEWGRRYKTNEYLECHHDPL